MNEFVRDPHHDRTKELTQRQRQVLRLLAEGHSMKEVAAVLNHRCANRSFHKYRIMEEFDLKTNSDLVRFAIRHHLSPKDSDAHNKCCPVTLEHAELLLYLRAG
ncbi:response regulator transcription factor [Edaphobacter aggregans]|uniref:response regulator transcription factor n=1 Tax=Edaphobacter aggregans TaxID=570835 RepID=UPI0021ADB900|nr:LuxR C-terminal-related transcriptional regulator [Edaphobacter aggregans]